MFERQSFRKESGQLMKRLKMKNFNTILIEKQQNDQYYHGTKLINIDFLQV